MLQSSLGRSAAAWLSIFPRHTQFHDSLCPRRELFQLILSSNLQAIWIKGAEKNLSNIATISA
ncbi:MAG: hypothetical protein C0508_10725 [Cyanobacteria bacterium PR.023]|jgi:hypothetical protein|nr:hypothetical protein [Cyanobacteria bacterium PR.023]